MARVCRRHNRRECSTCTTQSRAAGNTPATDNTLFMYATYAAATADYGSSSGCSDGGSSSSYDSGSSSSSYSSDSGGSSGGDCGGGF
jgi:hypothetical protein